MEKVNRYSINSSGSTSKTHILILIFVLLLTLVGCGETEKCDGTHRNSEWVVISEATCTKEGSKNLVCKDCGEVVTTSVINLENHIEGEWVVVEESSCYQAGTKVLKCKVCDTVIETGECELASHTVVIDEEVLPTCDTDGKTQGSHCSVCEEVIVSQTVIKANGHKYAINDEKSTDATLYYECSECGDHYEEENPDNTCKDHIESEWITVSNPTCTEKGLKHIVCTNCGLELRKEFIPADDHVPGEWIIEKESTCIESGLKYRVCDICEEVVEEEKIALSSHKSEIIPEVLPTCTETGLTEGSKCSVCDKVLKEQEVIPEKGHSHKLTYTKPSTKEETGYMEYTCECGDSYQKEIPVIGNYDPNSPTSILLGDNNTFVENDNGGVLVEGNTITISLAGEYDLVGKLSEGNVVVALEEADKATINLKGVDITSTKTNPIFVESGDKVDISANRNTVNYVNDNRKIEDGIDSVGAAIYSNIDLDVKGNGELYIKSTYNNGLSTTKDLEIKNLTLEVNAPNNAIKGNDSLTIESGTIKAISSSNDALSTENSDISDKGNQRGIITINSGTLDLFAACDAIDAAYNVIINGGTINAYTEKYSEYSGEVEVTASSKMYVRVSSKSGINNSNYTYAMKFISEDNKVTWVTGSKLAASRTVYYEFSVPTGAKYLKVYVYSSGQQVNNETTYAYASDQLTIPSAYDTYYITSANSSSKTLGYQWSNYGAEGMGGAPAGPGGGPGGPGMDGNNDKAAYSCKGIKADNEIIINDGTIFVKSHDDAVHTNSDVLLDTGKYGSANITINGGSLTLHSDDDALHADANLTINGGNVVITSSYEGIEGNNIYFKGGVTQIKSNDDGINAKSSLNFNGGIVYLDAGGDGIDSNNSAIMTGGVVLAQGPTNGGNGVIDFDRSFSFSGGLLLAIGCSGMNQKPTTSSGNTSTSKTISTNTSSYVKVDVNGKTVACIKVTKSSQNYCVLAYNNTSYPSATVNVVTSFNETLVNNLYYVAE